MHLEYEYRLLSSLYGFIGLNAFVFAVYVYSRVKKIKENNIKHLNDICRMQNGRCTFRAQNSKIFYPFYFLASAAFSACFSAAKYRYHYFNNFDSSVILSVVGFLGIAICAIDFILGDFFIVDDFLYFKTIHTLYTRKKIHMDNVIEMVNFGSSIHLYGFSLFLRCKGQGIVLFCVANKKELEFLINLKSDDKKGN